MTRLMAGSVAVRHTSKRSAQSPAVQRASATPTGSKACCAPAWAGAIAPAASSTARTGRRISLPPRLRPRPRDLDVQLVPPRLYLERDPRRLIPGVLAVHGRHLPRGQLAVAQRDRHDGDPV